MRMKNLLLKISTFLLCFQLSLSAQDFDANVKTGCDSLTVRFTYTSPVAVTNVKWTFGDGSESTEASPQHKYLTPKDYTVTLTLDNGTPIEKVGFIKVGLTPKADFTYNDTIPLGSYKTVFHAGQQNASAPFPYFYSWKVSDGASGTINPFVHQFDTAGIYDVKLIIYDLVGCADTITKAVTISKKLNVPNVFTPNGDNFNELLIIEGDGVTTFKLSVFSRSGGKVFSTSAQTLVWDGRMLNGEKARDGIFYYVIESINSNINLKQTGFFYLFGSSSNDQIVQ
jgi:gliding motility-associated-like protein